jgi:hypothetical protein
VTVWPVPSQPLRRPPKLPDPYTQTPSCLCCSRNHTDLSLSLHRHHASALDRRESRLCLNASAFSPNSSRRQPSPHSRPGVAPSVAVSFCHAPCQSTSPPRTPENTASHWLAPATLGPGYPSATTTSSKAASFGASRARSRRATYFSCANAGIRPCLPYRLGVHCGSSISGW